MVVGGDVRIPLSLPKPYLNYPQNAAKNRFVCEPVQLALVKKKMKT